LGNVRSEKVKRIARELFKRYPDKFTADFEKNKELIGSMVNISSKRLRNMIVGYVTRLAIAAHSEETTQAESA